MSKPSRLFRVVTACAIAGVLIGCSQSGDLALMAKARERNCAASSDARIHAMSDAGIGLASARGLPAGRFALPATPAPTQMVVMFHGHGNDSCSWRAHLRKVAQAGAVGIAMDYPWRREPEAEIYGWFVEEGAQDSIVAAQHFLARYPSIKTVYAFGVSMGGHASGMAVAAAATRADGTPLFDFWIDVEGVNNFAEAYLTYRSVAPFNDGAALAVREMEEEAGGPIEEVPERYAELSNVLRAPDMAYLRGAIIVHGIDDGLVSTDQSPQMAAVLNAAGVPTHLYTVFLRGDGESGGTGTGIVGGPLAGAAGQEYESPFAGHGWEGSDTHLVIKTGLDQLFALIEAEDPEVTPGATPVPGV